MTGHDAGDPHRKPHPALRPPLRPALRPALRSVALAASTLVPLFAIYPTDAAIAQDYVPPKIDTTTPTGVNLADGSFIYTTTDLVIGSLRLDRSHVGGYKDPNSPFFGPRMSHNFDIYVAKNFAPARPPFLPQRYKPVVHTARSAIASYVQEMGSTTIQPSTIDAGSGKLALVGAAYQFTAQDGTVYLFNPSVPVVGALGGTGSQRVATISYPNGRIETFSYNTSGQLKLVSDTMGYAIVFDYNGSGTVSAACGYNLAVTYVSVSSTCTSALLKTDYGYTLSKLTSVTDVFDQVTSFQYSDNHLTCIKPPSYTSCKILNTYYSGPNGELRYQVIQQTLADGAVWNYAYAGDYTSARSPSDYAETTPTGTTTLTDPLGKISRYSFSKTSPYAYIDANGKTTSYRYTGGDDFERTLYPEPPPEMPEGSLLVEAIFPEGNQYRAEYNGYNVLTKQIYQAKPGSGLADRVEQRGYDACSLTTRINCTNPTWIRDAMLNQTDLTYTGFGSVETEMQPPATPGAPRALKRYGYVQKYAYIKNAGGTLVPAATPVWMPISETRCQTVAGSSSPTCDASAPQTVTTYDYGPDGTADNLLLRGRVVTADGVSLRTCFGYDQWGNRIYETTPRAGLAVCS